MSKRSDYQRSITEIGEIEIVGYYEQDDEAVTISQPPDHSETLEKVIALLRGTGIAKLTITMLDDNLSPTTNGKDSE